MKNSFKNNYIHFFWNSVWTTVSLARASCVGALCIRSVEVASATMSIWQLKSLVRLKAKGDLRHAEAWPKVIKNSFKTFVGSTVRARSCSFAWNATQAISNIAWIISYAFRNSPRMVPLKNRVRGMVYDGLV